MVRRGNGAANRRVAASAVEMALLIPTVVFLFIVAFDFSRVFYYSSVVTACARAGALREADPWRESQPTYASTTAAAQANWPSALGTAPPVTVTYVTEGATTYADVNVSYTFQSVVSYTGIPATVNLSRTVRVRVANRLPDFS